MSKSGIAKVVAGAIFLGGITIAGVNYTGGDAIDSITNKATELQGRFNEAVADITYLQDEFDALNSLYADDMTKANGEITSLKDIAVGYRAQIRALQDEIEAGSTDNTTAQEEIQAEVTRLENALTEANNDIAGLEAYIAEIEADTQYEPINREAYVAEDLTLSNEADIISIEAYALDTVTATHYADNALAFSNVYSGIPDLYDNFTITGVDAITANGIETIAYVVDDASFEDLLAKTTKQSQYKPTFAERKNNIISGDLYLVNNNSDQVVYIDDEGYVNPA